MSTESSEDETESASLTKKVDGDDGDDDDDDGGGGGKSSSTPATAHSSQGYHNLETFQRKKLKQKVCKKIPQGQYIAMGSILALFKLPIF